MTLKQLKKIMNNLPEETILLVKEEEISDAKTIKVEYHADGRTYITFSTWE